MGRLAVLPLAQLVDLGFGPGPGLGGCGGCVGLGEHQPFQGGKRQVDVRCLQAGQGTPGNLPQG